MLIKYDFQSYPLPHIPTELDAMKMTYYIISLLVLYYMFKSLKHWTGIHVDMLWFNKLWWLKRFFTHFLNIAFAFVCQMMHSLPFSMQKYLKKIKTNNQFPPCISADHKHVEKGCDLRCRCLDEDSQLFCINDQGCPTSIPSKSWCHYLLQVFVLLNHSPEVCCLSPPLTCIHAHTSSKIVLVNEIRLNHALAFHQSLCDGCSPLIHGSQPLRLLPVCSDISNSLPYSTPCWAVDLPEVQGSPPAISH